LKGLKAGTAAFDAAWKREAKANPTKFNSAQHSYIEKSHYAPAANKFESVTGIKLASMPKAVKDMIWSIGVQHGSGGASTIFKAAGVKPGMSPQTILTRVYNERMNVNKYFKNSPQNIKTSVKNRFQRELNDALKMV